MNRLPVEVADKRWANLDEESKIYGDRFASSFTPYIQDQLDLGPFSDIGETIHNRYIYENTDLEKGLIGGSDVLAVDLARRAFLAGAIGQPILNYEEDVSPAEEYVCTEELYNEHHGQPKPTQKRDGQPFFVDIFTKEELSDRMAYWYQVGASNRMMGFIEERNKAYSKESNDD